MVKFKVNCPNRGPLAASQHQKIWIFGYFAKIQNCPWWSNTSSNKIIFKTKKLLIINIYLECAKILVSGQTLESYFQKNIFWEFCPLKQPESKDYLSRLIFLPGREYFGDLGIQPSWVCIVNFWWSMGSLGWLWPSSVNLERKGCHTPGFGWKG